MSHPRQYPNRNKLKTMLIRIIKLCNYQCLKNQQRAVLPQQPFPLRYAKQYEQSENGAGETLRCVLSIDN